jgi:hypothetical protein
MNKLPPIPQSSTTSSFTFTPEQQQARAQRAAQAKGKPMPAAMPTSLNGVAMPQQSGVHPHAKHIENGLPTPARMRMDPEEAKAQTNRELAGLSGYAAPLSSLPTDFQHLAAAQATQVTHPQPQMQTAQVPYTAHAHSAIANPMPVQVGGAADDQFSSLGLPSRFAYYKFKDLYVRPFKTPQLAKMSRAHKERSLLPIVEAVSSVCYTTTPGFEGVPLGFQLSVPDFFFVLYWLRLNSYTKSNYVHTTSCNNPEHIKAVEEGKLPKESLKISQLVTKTMISHTELETIPNPEVYHFSESSAMVFRPTTMGDTLQYNDDPRMNDPNQKAEFEFKADYASYIQHRDIELPLAERVNIIEAADPDHLELIDRFIAEVSNYGVNESITVQCKGCGASRVTRLTLDAHSFLPSNGS